MKILQVVDTFINLDLTSKVCVEDGERDVVLFKYKDIRGDWYTSSLTRKASYVAEPLTVEIIKNAYVKALKYFESGHDFANLSNFVDDDEEEIPDDED